MRQARSIEKPQFDPRLATGGEAVDGFNPAAGKRHGAEQNRCYSPQGAPLKIRTHISGDEIPAFKFPREGVSSC